MTTCQKQIKEVVHIICVNLNNTSISTYTDMLTKADSKRYSQCSIQYISMQTSYNIQENGKSGTLSHCNNLKYFLDSKCVP